MIVTFRDSFAYRSGEVLPNCSIMPQKTALINLETKLSGRDFIMIVTWRDSSVCCSGEVLPACSIMPQQTALLNLET
jgi:hypothetical protein